MVSISLFSISASLFLLFKYIHLYHFSRSHIQGILYNFVFLFLTYFTLHGSLTLHMSMHVSANVSISLLFMTEYYSTVYMHHIFLIHSSVDGHLGYFHVPAIVNCAAVNTRMRVSFYKLSN